MMRLFIACDIPGNLRQALVTLQKNIGEEHAHIKWVEQDNIHLTLKFLGDVEDEKVDRIKDAIMKIKSKAIDARISGFGVFPTESYIRVLWVGIEPAGDLEKLHEEIDAALSGLGFKTDPTFKPHATLGRVKSVRNREGLLKKVREIKERNIEMGEKFRMDQFKLKKSTLTPSGPVYEDVAVVELA